MTRLLSLFLLMVFLKFLHLFLTPTRRALSLARFLILWWYYFDPLKPLFDLNVWVFFHVDYCWAVSKLGTYIFNRKIFMGCKRRPNKVCQIKGVNSLFQRFIGALFGRQMYTLLSGLYLFVSVCIFNPHVIPILISGKIFDEMAWFFSLSLAYSDRVSDCFNKSLSHDDYPQYIYVIVTLWVFLPSK